MVKLFDRDVKTIGKHINNALQEELDGEVVVAKFATTTPHGAVEGKTQTHMTDFYSLDVIISVGYRVKSKRGVEFRKWANSVLRQYILQGYAVNSSRITQLGEVIKIMKRTENTLDSRQVLTVIEKYSEALTMLDSYDHQNMSRPKGNNATCRLTYEECMEVISHMRFGDESDLFGREKDDSFRGQYRQYLSVIWRTGIVSEPRGKSCASSVLCYKKSQFSRRQQENCGYYVSVFS